MRTIVLMWAVPLTAFWGWFFLSANDINFGQLLLSRRMHEFVFEVYGAVLGVDPSEVPWMAAKACAFDSLIVLSLCAFKSRKAIAARIEGRRFSRRIAAAAAGNPPR